MRGEKDSVPQGSNISKEQNAHHDSSQKKTESRFLGNLKKVGFTVWLAVMIIGGALAFVVALFLV